MFIQIYIYLSTIILIFTKSSIRNSNCCYVIGQTASKFYIYTAEFCELFNSLFDIFNSQGPNENEYISGLYLIRYIGDRYTNNLPCIIGWKNNVSLYSNIESEFNISRLNIHNCTQDSIEIFFSIIRAGGENIDNPLALEFLAEYRKVAVDSLFCNIRGSNCQVDASDFLIKNRSTSKLLNNPNPPMLTYQ